MQDSTVEFHVYFSRMDRKAPKFSTVSLTHIRISKIISIKEKNFVRTFYPECKITLLPNFQEILADLCHIALDMPKDPINFFPGPP